VLLQVVFQVLLDQTVALFKLILVLVPTIVVFPQALADLTLRSFLRDDLWQFIFWDMKSLLGLVDLRVCILLLVVLVDELNDLPAFAPILV